MASAIAPVLRLEWRFPSGSLISIFGHNLTSGSTLQADPRNTALKLAGTTVKLDGTPIPILYVSPGQVNAYVPLDRVSHDCTPTEWFSCSGKSFTLDIVVSGGTVATAELAAPDSTPGVF